MADPKSAQMSYVRGVKAGRSTRRERRRRSAGMQKGSAVNEGKQLGLIRPRRKPNDGFPENPGMEATQVRERFP